MITYSCAASALTAALRAAEKFAAKNSTLPILECIQLQLRETALDVIATNLEAAIRVRVHGTPEKKGDVISCIPAKIASAVLQSIGADRITIDFERDGVIFRTAEERARIRGVPADDFPVLPRIARFACASVPAPPLRQALAAALPMVSASKFKPELGGVFFRIAGGGITIAATDTFRLGEASCDAPSNMDKPFSFILPSGVGHEIVKILDRAPSVSIETGENQIAIQAGDFYIISRLVDGAYPEYQGIIPREFSTSGFIGRDALIRAVRSSSLFASKLGDVRLRMRPEDATLEVLAENADSGTHTARLPADFSGPGLEVSFNFQYLLDGLLAVADEDIFLGCTGETTPALIRGKSDASFRYVIMPVRLS